MTSGSIEASATPREEDADDAALSEVEEDIAWRQGLGKALHAHLHDAAPEDDE